MSDERVFKQDPAVTLIHAYDHVFNGAGIRHRRETCQTLHVLMCRSIEAQWEQEKRDVEMSRQPASLVH